MYVRRKQDVMGMGNAVTEVLFGTMFPITYIGSKLTGDTDNKVDASGNPIPGPISTFTGAVGKGVGTAVVVVAGLAAAYFIFLAESGRRKKRAIGL